MASRAVSTPSALSGTLGECIGEFFGTMVLILFGDGCVATFGLFRGPLPGANEWTVIILGGAQVLGAFVAAGILYFVYKGAIDNAIGGANIADTAKGVGYVFYTSPKDFVGTFGAFGDEFIGTALLVGLIFAIVDGRNQPVQGNINPFIIGLLIVAIGASFGGNSGYAINPARDFGPRLWIALVSGGASFSAKNYYFWVPIVAPLLGGVAGAFIYDFTIGKVLAAKGLGPSGDTETKGEAVREPAV